MLRHLMRCKLHEFLRNEQVPERMTLDEIAEFCGVDRMVIYRTEQEALQKIRSKFPKNDLK
jgi:DNA-directed RNA polymerase specialized sigma subunit